MAITHFQDKAFISEVVSDDLLKKAVEWIQNNMEPEDVFEHGKLSTWAVDSGYIRPECDYLRKSD